MKARDTKIALHRNVRDQIRQFIHSELGTEIYRTRIERGQSAGQPDHHVWTTIHFCPYLYDAVWVVGHSIYRVIETGRLGGASEVSNWDFWNMSDLPSALRLFNYLINHKEALGAPSVELAPEPHRVPIKMESPLKRGDQRAEVAREFMGMLTERGVSYRANDTIVTRMTTFVRGCTIDRTNCYYSPDEWVGEANGFTRYISSDQFNIDSTRASALRDRARILVAKEKSEAG